MPTVIDALVVELGLDPTKFTEGQKAAVDAFKKTQEAARKSGGEIEKRAAAGADFFKTMRNQALGLFAVLVGGKDLFNFAVDTTNKLAAMRFAAANIGQTVPQFAKMVNVVEQLGGSADAAAQSAFNLSQQMQRAKLFGPTPELQVGLSRIGAGLGDSLDVVYDKFNKFAQTVPRQEALLFGQQFLGLDVGTLNALLQSREKYLQTLSAVSHQNLPSDQDADKVRNLQQAFTSLREAIENTAFASEGDLAPALTEIISDMKEGIAQTRTWQQVLEDFKNPFSWLLPGLTVIKAASAFDTEHGLTIGSLSKRLYDWATGRKPSPDATSASGSFGGQSPRAGAGVAAKQAYMYDYLTHRGIAPAAARGIVAGATAENASLDPNKVNPTSGAYGIEQVLGDRKRGLFGRYGTKPTLDNELDYLIYDLKGGDRGGASVLGSNRDDTALLNYIINFMRPRAGEETAGDLRRGAEALQLVRTAQSASNGAGAAADNRKGDVTTTIGDVHIHTPTNDPRRHGESFRDQILVDQANAGIK